MLRGRNPTPGGLLKPAFGLSGDLQISFNFVIPTGTDHRKAMIRGVEGPAVVTSSDRVSIRRVAHHFANSLESWTLRFFRGKYQFLKKLCA